MKSREFVSYCVKCRRSVSLIEPAPDVLKGGERVVRGACPSCGTTIIAKAPALESDGREGKPCSVITVTGDPGSGKTSLCRRLADDGWSVATAGDLFREEAAKAEIGVTKLNDRPEASSLDSRIDEWVATLGKGLGRVVIDGRMAWHFVPRSFKVLLRCDPETAARRVMGAVGRKAESYGSLEECAESLKARQAAERGRFKRAYGVDFLDEGNYDLVIDTTLMTTEEAVSLLMDAMGAPER